MDAELSLGYLPGLVDWLLDTNEAHAWNFYTLLLKNVIVVYT